MIAQHAFQQRPQIHSRHKVSTFKERALVQSRPIRDYVSTVNRAARNECGAAITMIRPERAVGSGGPPKFRGSDHDCLAPGRTEANFNALECGRKVAEQPRNSSARHPLPGMGIPLPAFEHRDAGAIWTR